MGLLLLTCTYSLLSAKGKSRFSMSLSASEPNNAQNNEQKLTNQRSSFLTIKQKAKKLKVCNLRSGTKRKNQRETCSIKKASQSCQLLISARYLLCTVCNYKLTTNKAIKVQRYVAYTEFSRLYKELNIVSFVAAEDSLHLSLMNHDFSIKCDSWSQRKKIYLFILCFFSEGLDFYLFGFHLIDYNLMYNCYIMIFLI